MPVATVKTEVVEGSISNFKKLRIGNMIEIRLNIDEGVTDKEFYIGLRASGNIPSPGYLSAKEFAKKFIEDKEIITKFNLNNDKSIEAYKDVARHYSWNVIMTSEFYKISQNIDSAKLKARKIANNHEWGRMLISEYMDIYYNNLSDAIKQNMKYVQYYSLYTTQVNDSYLDEMILSTAAALDEVSKMKKDKMTSFDCNYKEFSANFSEADIMDYWNNCYGRADYLDLNTVTNVESAIKESLLSRLNKNELIVYVDEPGFETKSKNVWSWKWYE